MEHGDDDADDDYHYNYGSFSKLKRIIRITQHVNSWLCYSGHPTLVKGQLI